jgi:tRNA-specific 2-thiouridylase
MDAIAVAVSGGADSLLALALVRETGRPAVALHGRFLDENLR